MCIRDSIICDARLLVDWRRCAHERLRVARKSRSGGIARRVGRSGSFVFTCQIDRTHWRRARSDIFFPNSTIRAAHRMVSSRRYAEPLSINRIDDRIVWIPANAEGVKMTYSVIPPSWRSVLTNKVVAINWPRLRVQPQRLAQSDIVTVRVAYDRHLNCTSRP